MAPAQTKKRKVLAPPPPPLPRRQGRAELPNAVLEPKIPWLTEFTEGFLHKESLFPFLHVNDLTNLSITCRALREKVSSVRTAHLERNSSNPASLIWETVLPTKIGFENVEDEVLAVFQIKTFGFLFRTLSSGETIHVEFSLQNKVWFEHDNAGYTTTRVQFPSPTTPKIAIVRPRRNLVHPPQEGQRLFVEHPLHLHGNASVDYSCFLGRWEENGVNEYMEEDRDDRPEHEKQELCEMMRYTLFCPQRIAENGTTTYPSAAYLMRALPEWLYKYFPDTFDWDAAHADRATNVEFEYGPFPTLEE